MPDMILEKVLHNYKSLKSEDDLIKLCDDGYVPYFLEVKSMDFLRVIEENTEYECQELNISSPNFKEELLVNN